MTLNNPTILNTVANLMAQGAGALSRHGKMEPPGKHLSTSQAERLIARVLSARLNNRVRHRGVTQQEDGKWSIQRMMWTKTDGVWRGHWVPQPYDQIGRAHV